MSVLGFKICIRVLFCRGWHHTTTSTRRPVLLDARIGLLSPCAFNHTNAPYTFCGAMCSYTTTAVQGRSSQTNRCKTYVAPLRRLLWAASTCSKPMHTKYIYIFSPKSCFSYHTIPQPVSYVNTYLVGCAEPIKRQSVL